MMRELTPQQPLLLVVAAALVDTSGRVLLQQRPPHKQMGGLWEFPGGKVENGETPEAAILRELSEELDIIVDHSCLAPACFASEPLGDRHLLLLLFVLRKWQGTPKPLDATAMQWVTPAQMFSIDMPPADRPLIGLLDALL